jgi:hypothetical protein
MPGIGDQRPPSVDWLVRRVEDLEREVRQLKSARALSASSFRGGQFIFQDPDGNERWRMGDVDTPNGPEYGIIGRGDGGGIVFAVQETNRGLVYPNLSVPVYRSDLSISVTSGTFVEVLQVREDTPPAEVFFIEFVISCAASTTAEAKIVDNGSPSVAETDIATVPANTSTLVRFEWLHDSVAGWGDDRWDVLGGSRSSNFFPIVNVRRASGAGSVTVNGPITCYFTSREFKPNAAVNGNPFPT